MRWPTDVLCTVDGVILVLAVFVSLVTWCPLSVDGLTERAALPVTDRSVLPLFKCSCEAGSCHHSIASFITCDTGAGVSGELLEATC